MKIAVIYHYGREVGGTESYLSAILPALATRGNKIAFLHEVDGDSDRPPIQLPATASHWNVSQIGIGAAIESLRRWSPDVIYAHGVVDPELEERFLEIAPAILYVHSYYGACISGHKTNSFPTINTCRRKFGPACLIHYFPRHCGGMSPFTMLSSYQLQARRQKSLPAYRMVLTNSEHMATEYRRYNLDARCLYLFPRGNARPKNEEHQFVALPKADEPWRLLYLGRMSQLKGGDALIDSLPDAQKKLGQKIHLTMAGNGPEFENWRRHAESICHSHPGLQIEFTGWVEGQARDRIIATTHLHVLPSMWPEPFGLSGLECGLRGIPSVAFAVGGTPEWLTDGQNGCLADSDPSTPQKLGASIVRALKDPQTFRKLQQGALHQTRTFTLEKHLRELTTALEEASQLGTSSPESALSRS